MTARRTAAHLHAWLLGLTPCVMAGVVSIVTPGCGSKNAPLGGGSEEDASGSSSGGAQGSGSGSSSGATSGSGSGSGAHSSSGSSSSGSSSCTTGKVMSQVEYDSNCNPLCGTSGCDLKTSICCVSVSGAGSCISDTSSCPTLDAQFKCIEASDCPSGQVCCGVAVEGSSGIGGSAGTECQDVSSTSNECQPVATGSNPTMGSAQVCQTTAECKNGQTCQWQDCDVMGTAIQLTMCGIQSQAPFGCTAHQYQ